jgi:hypothetical protein
MPPTCRCNREWVLIRIRQCEESSFIEILMQAPEPIFTFQIRTPIRLQRFIVVRSRQPRGASGPSASGRNIRFVTDSTRS